MGKGCYRGDNSPKLYIVLKMRVIPLRTNSGITKCIFIVSLKDSVSLSPKSVPLGYNERYIICFFKR